MGIELCRAIISYVSTVWYTCTPVACDSRYSIYGSQPDTKRSCRSLSMLIDRYHNFASIFLHFKKCSYFTDCFFFVFRQHCCL